MGDSSPPRKQRQTIAEAAVHLVLGARLAQPPDADEARVAWHWLEEELARILKEPNS